MKKKKKKILLIAGMVVLAIAAAGAAFLYSFLSVRPDREGMLYICPEMTERAFADSLSTKFGERFAERVLWLADIRNTNLSRRAGAYRIEKEMSAVDTWKMIASRTQTPVRFTFNNVRTVEEFAERAAAQLAMKKEDLLQLVDSAGCAQRGFTEQTIPAMLLPDTYEVYWSVSPEKLLDKMERAYRSFWTDARQAKAARLGLSPEEVSTLASIVDSETADRSEKGTIARLYLNRLEKGMKLQSDPTVKFAVGDAGLRRIVNKHLSVESPYNTYQVAGLPPGPIRLPEKGTLEAVLNAPEHDYLYMCAKEDFSGSHNFTSSYSRHLQNARRYQQELNRRGIK